MSRTNTDQPVMADDVESALDAAERRLCDITEAMRAIIHAVSDLPRLCAGADTAINELRELLEESQPCSNPTTPNSPPIEGHSDPSS